MRRLLLFVATVVSFGCDRTRSSSVSPPAPHAEFLVSAGDSSFWVVSGPPGVRVRGSPILLARYGGKFYEIFVADDDYSYEDALLVGERLYRRDISTGDSTLVFADTVVAGIARTYARAHPGARPLERDEETNPEPGTSATVELDVLELFGPYLSYEYHADVERKGAGLWHTTRHGVIDLRSGKPALVADLFGEQAGREIAAIGRRAYEAARDSVVRERGSSARAFRGVDALEHLRFDESSFALETVDGKPAVRFAIPGRGEGPAGSVVELDPIPVDPAPWWSELRGGLPEATDSADYWDRSSYRLTARYDTSGEVAHLVLSDSTRAWSVGTMRGPLHRIDWLDAPPLDSLERRALSHAFDEARSYDEHSRIAAAPPRGLFRFAVRAGPVIHVRPQPTHATRLQDRRRKPARNVRTHDAR